MKLADKRKAIMKGRKLRRITFHYAKFYPRGFAELYAKMDLKLGIWQRSIEKSLIGFLRKIWR
jgi:hypothetical protein